jgi:cobalt-zinc-cadmium efflux system membrane fusion protein
LALACAVGACTSHANETNAPSVPAGQAWLTPQQLKDASITITPVGMHAVGGAIVTSGRITFDDLRVSHVFSPVSGRVTKIIAQPGQRVKKDQTLAIIQSPDLGQAFSDLAKAQAAAEQADKDFKRQNELYDAHAGAQRDFEAAKAVSMAAKAELTRAQRKAHLLASAGGGSDTQEFPLRSPLEGEVIIRNVNPGIEVQGTYGGGQAVELFTIGELDRVWVMADVFEIDLAKVKQGSHVSLKVVAYPDRIFEGLVEYVADSLDPASRTARVRISVDNKERLLKPEMFATVQIATDQRSALAIPRTALLRLGDQNVVFVQVGTTKTGELEFERRPVAVDEEQGGDFLPVTHGLNDGDKVVSSGGILLLGML